MAFINNTEKIDLERLSIAEILNFTTPMKHETENFGAHLQVSPTV